MRTPAAMWLLAALLLACTTGKVEVQPPAPVTSPAPAAAPAPAAPRPTVERQVAPGETRTTVEGCLAVQGESEASRFPVPPATRSVPPPPVTVTAIPGGLLVTHRLAHACCLRSEVSTHVGAREVVILEKLSGVPCRCMCSSTLRTSAGLAPGRWDVAVDLDTGREVQRVFAGTTVVAPPP